MSEAAEGKQRGAELSGGVTLNITLLQTLGRRSHVLKYFIPTPSERNKSHGQETLRERLEQHWTRRRVDDGSHVQIRSSPMRAPGTKSHQLPQKLFGGVGRRVHRAGNITGGADAI